MTTRNHHRRNRYRYQHKCSNSKTKKQIKFHPFFGGEIPNIQIPTFDLAAHINDNFYLQPGNLNVMDLNNREKNFLLPITHVLMMNDYELFAYFFYDAKNIKDKYRQILKQILLHEIEDRLQKPTSLPMPDRLEYLNNLQVEVENEDSVFWQQNRYYNIGYLFFNITKKHQYEVDICLLSGRYLIKTGGHYLVCLCIQLLQKMFGNYNIDTNNVHITLEAYNLEVEEKFYRRIGFVCNDLLCHAPLSKLLTVCNDMELKSNNYSLAILQPTLFLNWKDVYYTDLTMFFVGN